MRRNGSRPLSPFADLQNLSSRDDQIDGVAAPVSDPMLAHKADPGSYVARLSALPPGQRFAMARHWMVTEPHAFFAELRDHCPVLDLGPVVLVSRFADCCMILRRHQDFSVALYSARHGDHFMAQDDTPDHWRDKGVMRAILDYEDIPLMRDFVGRETARLLDAAQGSLDAPQHLTRDVPIALVRHYFGFTASNAEKLRDWAYWKHQDSFHNQQFDTDPAESILISDNARRANRQLTFHIARLIAIRKVELGLRRKPRDPIARLLMLSQSGALHFPVRKIISNVGALLLGAVENSSHAVINVVAELARRSDVMTAARRAAASDDHGLFDGYVFEALRFNPITPYLFRLCQKRTLLAAGTPFATAVEPGRTVIALTHSAMFDSMGFDRPDMFDPSRSQSDSFTFGQGIHECLGRAIAMAIIPEIVRQCLLRPDFHVDNPPRLERRVPEHHLWHWKA